MGCVAFGNNFLLKCYCKNRQAHSTPCGCLDRLRKLLDHCRKNPIQFNSILTACKFHLLLVMPSNCKANLIMFGMKCALYKFQLLLLPKLTWLITRLRKYGVLLAKSKRTRLCAKYFISYKTRWKSRTFWQ